MKAIAALAVVVLAAANVSAGGCVGTPSDTRCAAAIKRANSNLLRKVFLTCRDGDPFCDADQSCDGMCMVNICFVGQYFHGCADYGVGLCVLQNPEPVPAGTTRYFGTLYASRNVG